MENTRRVDLSACRWAGTRPSQWEEQLQDLAKEHMGSVDGARSRSEADPDTPYGADITITEPAPKLKKRSWLSGIGKSGPAAPKPTGTPPVAVKGSVDRLYAD